MPSEAGGPALHAIRRDKKPEPELNELIILKIGGAVITNKESDTPEIRSEVLERIAKEIASVYDKNRMSLAIIHGGGSFGHPYAAKAQIDKGIGAGGELQSFAELQLLMTEMNCIVTRHLIEAGIPAFPCQASASAVTSSCKLVKMDLSAIEGLMKLGIVPILYGVPAYDDKLGYSILSGDEIGPYLALNLKAKKIRVIYAGDVEGLCTADPKIDAKARLIPVINSKNIGLVKLTGSTATDVTGGMVNKISKLLGLLERGGIESQLIDALVPGNITRALNGDESFGTMIKNKNLRSRMKA